MCIYISRVEGGDNEVKWQVQYKAGIVNRTALLNEYENNAEVLSSVATCFNSTKPHMHMECHKMC
jgi:hypothetical protein